MFDIGFWELALIGIVALLVVGPEKMPIMIRTAGQWAGHIQRIARDLRREIDLEAQSEEYRALNRDFLAEDKKLKDLARNPVKVIAESAAGDGVNDEGSGEVARDAAATSKSTNEA